MNLSKHSEDKELFSKNTMNLSKHSEDKELFSKKNKILKILNDILSYYESLNKNSNKIIKYKIDSYKKAIKSIEDFKEPIYNANNIKNLEYIGKGFYEKINEICKTGKLKIYENLKKNKKLDKLNSIKKFKKIWGIGDIAVKKIIDKRIYTIENLKKQIKNNKVKLTEQQKIGLKYYNNLNKRIPREEIIKYTIILKKYIKYIEKELNKNSNNKIILELHNAGSYRTGKKDSGDIDLILTINNDYNYTMNLSKRSGDKELFSGVKKKENTMNLSKRSGDKELFSEVQTKENINKIQKLFYNLLTNNNIIKETLSKGTEKSIYIVKLEDEKYYRQMDIAFIDNKYLPWYLLYFGSSKDFSKKIRFIASKKGYKLNEKGLFNKVNGKRIDFNPNNEKEIFDYLNIDYIKPEDRK